MIVWGGYYFDNTNTGGRYNPSTNTLIASSTINAPTARVEHTGVWTGSEMLVWGGIDDSGLVNTGGRYCEQYPTPTPTSYSYTNADGNCKSNSDGHSNAHCNTDSQFQPVTSGLISMIVTGEYVLRFLLSLVYVHLIVSQSNNGESLSRAGRFRPKASQRKALSVCHSAANHTLTRQR